MAFIFFSGEKACHLIACPKKDSVSKANFCLFFSVIYCRIGIHIKKLNNQLIITKPK